MGRMGFTPILPVRWPIIFGTIIKFNGDGNGVEDGVGMCKQALIMKMVFAFHL